MSKKFILHFTNPKRKEMYEKIFGNQEIYVESPFSFKGEYDGKICRYYKLDLNEATKQQRDKLIEIIGNENNMDSFKVDRMINLHGIPIRAKGCYVEIRINK